MRHTRTRAYLWVGPFSALAIREPPTWTYSWLAAFSLFTFLALFRGVVAGDSGGDDCTNQSYVHLVPSYPLLPFDGLTIPPIVKESIKHVIRIEKESATLDKTRNGDSHHGAHRARTLGSIPLAAHPQ